MKDSSVLSALIKMKAIKEKNAEGKITVSAGRETEKVSFEVERLTADKVLSIVENSMKENQREWQTNRSLIYAAIPELQDRELLEEYDCLKNPEKIVEEFFTRGDIITLGRELSKAIDRQISIKN